MAEEETTGITINFVPAICFVPRGVAKEKPDKIELKEDELYRIIKETQESLAEEEEDANSDQDADDPLMDVDGNSSHSSEVNDADITQEHNENQTDDDGDEYAFVNYDNEGNVLLATICNVVNPDHLMADEDIDSEADDDIIKPTDNLLLVGHVQDETSTLEVWVFNEVEESLYTFHDFMLPSFPLCIEWLNHDPGSDKAGNMCAIGGMDPIITIWDLDVQNSMEPTFKLGSKGSRKKQKAAYGHKDAVLDLSWNRQYEHILASGSADKSLLLWDLDEGQPHTTVTVFNDKLQSVEFHPAEAQLVLTGCADGYVRLIDCRDAEVANNSFTKWKINKEVEKVLWNPNNINYFIIGDNAGALHYADKRQSKNLLWSCEAHEEEVSGVCFNTEIPNLLTSTSTEGCLKIWDFNSSEIKHVYTHDFKIGRLQCMKQCPEDPFTLAFGGEKPPRCLVYNIKNLEAVRRAFNIADVLHD